MRNAQWNKRQEAQQQKDWEKATRPERRREQAAERTMGAAAEGMQYFEEHPEEQAPAGQEERRARAQSHGSLRQARGFGPEDPTATYSTDVDPGNQIGAGMAEELIQGLRPGRRRRIERERREGGGGEE
jgi:hypothetical protein